MRARSRRWPALRLAMTALSVVCAVAYIAAWAVPLPERLYAGHSASVNYADGAPAHVFLSTDDKWRLPVELSRVDADYVDALVAYEDERFWWHPGVDPIAIGRAAMSNASHGTVVSGASTITMQLVRLLEPRPRTLRSKGIEALRAMQLELFMSKEEILQAYLTYTSYGRNVEGIESASLAYFGHPPDELSSAEIATLLAVPQSPTRRYPSAGNTDRLRQARDDIAAQLELPNVIDEAVPERLAPMPREAPHAAIWLNDGSTRVDTTLDRGVQRLAERAIAAAAPGLVASGVHNGAVVIVEHQTGDIKALVGSLDFHDADHGGQIAGFDVPRSPGSALKPVIYAMGIERGLVLPEHLVLDIPAAYGTYAPENYDGQFDGLVPLQEALSRSLNIPFVNLLQQIGVEDFTGELRGMGADHLSWQPGHYGLSAAIGGVELTPIEVAGIYAALAQDGHWRRLRVRQGDVPDAGHEVLAPGATWLTRRALSLRDRPDFPSRVALSQAPRRIHWKTGTSFGNRDAWAVGSGERYTVAVWLGNFDNTGSMHLVGAEAAGPILFDLLEGLGDGLEHADNPSDDLADVHVCSLSGRLATGACSHTTVVKALRTAVPAQTCTLHRHMEVDIATGLAVRPGCREGRETEQRPHVVWPSAVRRYLHDRRRQASAAPRWDPGCHVADGGPPEVVSPAQGEVLMLIPGVPPVEQEVALQGQASTTGTELAWFVDGQLLGKAGVDERIWWTPRKGRHEILLMDGAGRSSRRWFEVR